MKNYKLSDFLSRAGLNMKRNNGLILFDYSKETQYNADWDDITLASRGIVFNEKTGEIVAKAYDKFFNFDEIADGRYKTLPEKFQPNFDGECMVLEKADGSLGIVYFYNNEWHVNTRGSFASEQAIWGKSFLYENIKTDLMNTSYTYLFEIIYPENRIVVDYGDLKTLRLTGIIVTKTGEELWIDELQKEAAKIGCEVVESYSFNSLDEMFKARQNLSVNEEGYVITYKNGYKFKVKGEAYCQVHRSLCAMTPLSFWRAFDIETMRIPDNFLSELPEEFKSTIDSLTEITEYIHSAYYNSVCDLVETVPSFDMTREGRKARFNWVSDNIDSSYVHHVLGVINARLSNTSDWKVREKIHRIVRPTNNSFDGLDVDERLLRVLDEID